MSKSSNDILLSICIPTFNRSDKLKETLDSIVSQTIFIESNKVEIVISDNFSVDSTFYVAQKYCQKFPNKIVYSRNDKNIVDKNFEKVLSIARGSYLKLNNDTLIHKDGSLVKIIDLLEANLNEKPVLFFSNGMVNSFSLIEGFGLPLFLEKVSYWITWIALFGIWKEDFLTFPDFNRSSQLHLIQVDILFELINQKSHFLIEDSVIFTSDDTVKKGGYDLLSIFLDNYNYLLKQQVDFNNITQNDLDREMKRIINEFLTVYLAKSIVNKHHYNFILFNWYSRINKFYKFNFTNLSIFYSQLFYNILYEFYRKFK